MILRSPSFTTAALVLLLWSLPATAEAPSLADGAPEEVMLPPVITTDEGSATDELPHPVSVQEEEPLEGVRGANDPRLKHDILSVGGFYFQRAELSGLQGPQETNFQPRIPSLVDVVLDVKPSEDFRSLVRGRLLFDPLDARLSTPQILLDQFWLQFSVAQRVFITAGRQQLLWGSSRIWNPTDFLRRPNPRPLEAFDERLGIDMLKVNIPWEEMASNLWVIATVDLNGPAERPLTYGGAVRAEVTLGISELSATAVFKQGRRPRYGLDWSVGAGPFDFNAELALVRDNDLTLWGERTGTGFAPRRLDGPTLLASSGVTGTFRVADLYRTVFRLEGLYNQLGYEDRAVLTWLHKTKTYRPLYFGRYYGMAQLAVTQRSRNEPTLTLTGLMNVSDRSVLSRLDYTTYVQRDIILQCYLEKTFGERGSEFLFEPDPTVADDLPTPERGLFRAGLSIRFKI